MLKTKNEKTADLIKEFYAKPYYLSYSGLNKLLYSPSLFYNHYVLQQREEKVESYFIEGKLIHCLLLDDGSFNDQFLLMPTNIPTANTKTVVDHIHQLYLEGDEREKLKDYSNEILEKLKEMNLHQRLADDKNGDKTGDEKRLEKIVTEESNTYFQFLKIKDTKIVVDSSLLESSREAVEVIRKHEEACELLGVYSNEMDNHDHYYEIEVKIDIPDYPFGLKGILDNVKVDYDKKKIFINDLKKTSKALTSFKDAVDYYNYWAQAAIYYRLARSKFKNLFKEEGWEIVFTFIVIDKYLQIYPFEVSRTTMIEWLLEITDSLDIVKWHYENKKYDLPFEFATGKIVL